MQFLIAGGRPDFVREVFVIKDSEGYISTTKEYVRGNPELFTYINTVRINSVETHIFRFDTAP